MVSYRATSDVTLAQVAWPPCIPSVALLLSTNRQLGSAVVTVEGTGAAGDGGEGLPNDGELEGEPFPLTKTESLVKTGPKR